MTPPFLGRALETGRVEGNDFHFGLILPFQEESGQAELHWVSHACCPFYYFPRNAFRGTFFKVL